MKPVNAQKPTITELGADLLKLSFIKLALTLVVPFAFLTFYFVFAFNGFWIPAVICTMGLSFTTYGSTSHDLVHQNLRINKKANTVLLTMIELLCFRSGHAYRLSHLYHHKRYPHEDDVEGAAARMTLWGTLLEGIIFQFKIYRWALRHSQRGEERRMIVFEGFLVAWLVSFCIYSLTFTNVFAVYCGLMIMGSWIIPLITSYAVHTPHGENELQQTRLFRGNFFSIVAVDHLYHLEHHLYPMVPHKNWPRLARRLDAYFARSGVTPTIVKFKSIDKI